MQRDVRAGARQCPRHGGAEAAGRAGHERDAAAEIERRHRRFLRSQPRRHGSTSSPQAPALSGVEGCFRVFVAANEVIVAAPSEHDLHRQLDVARQVVLARHLAEIRRWWGRYSGC